MSDDNVLDPYDFDREIKANYTEAFDTSIENRKTFGSIPPEVHTAVLNRSSDNGLMVGQCIASMLSFIKAYETEYEEYLTEQREAHNAKNGSLI